MHSEFDRELCASLGKLRGLAILITRDETSADDLLQEAILRALLARKSYSAGTNFVAWMYTILRNQHITNWRRGRRAAIHAESRAVLASGMEASVEGNQESRVALNELRCALQELPLVQREALMLVGPADFTYEDAASAVGCSIGTIKSRVSRARSTLRQKLMTAEAAVIGTLAGSHGEGRNAEASNADASNADVGAHGRQGGSQAGPNPEPDLAA
jgi:RNA polymerase sigma-70 factor (ECF subfamily)